MNRQIKHLVGLSAFAAACVAVGMGLSRGFLAQAYEDKPVTVDAKGLEHLPPIADVAEKLNPTVVSITNTSFVKRGRAQEFNSPFGGGDPFEFFFGPQNPGGRRTPRNSEEEQRVPAGGSGVVVSHDGEILTNFHVIEGVRGAESNKIEVKFSDGRTFKAQILGKDRELDIALIKVDATHLPYAKLGDSEALRVGEWVVAIGNPLGLEHTVTQGIISSKGRKLTSNIESFLQTDAAINRGNSGGPLLNLRGEVIGINTAINPAGQNLGFAVPINLVKRVLADLRSGKPVSRGYLGIQPVELDKEFQDSLGVKEGVVVGDITRGQAADKAGLKRLDVITHIEGQKIGSPDDLVGAVSVRRAGEALRLTVIRDGKAKDLSVILGDRKDIANADAGDADEPEAGGSKPSDSSTFQPDKAYGFSVEALTPPARHQYGLPDDVKGVVVVSVSPRSGAADKNLRPGMVITAVGTQEVTSIQEFNTAARKFKDKPLLVQVAMRDGRGGVVRQTFAIPHK